MEFDELEGHLVDLIDLAESEGFVRFAGTLAGARDIIAAGGGFFRERRTPAPATAPETAGDAPARQSRRES